MHSLFVLLVIIAIVVIVLHILGACCKTTTTTNPEVNNWTVEPSIWRSSRCTQLPDNLEAFENPKLEPNGMPVTWEKTGLNNEKYANESQFKKFVPEFDHYDFLAQSKFDKKCCPSFYSNSMGCACLTKNQNMQLLSRGDNNVPFHYGSV
jgi:hypothetical protein